MKLIKHQLDEPIDFTIPVSGTELSMEDKTEVMRMILKHWLIHNPPLKHFPGLELLRLEWTWLDSLKRTLPQRIIYLLKKHNAIMTPAFYGKMGNHLRETIPTASRYLLDFTRKFDWVSGQYGDGRSCFMNGGARTGVVREMQRNGNFYAMRFYQETPVPNRNGMILLANTIPKYTKDSIKHYGKARVFVHYREIMVRKGGKIVKEPVYFMFNSYGKESLREMAAVFAAYVGASFRSVKLSNIGKACGGLYINSGSMIIGHKKVVMSIKAFDFQFKTTFDEAIRARALGMVEVPIGIRERLRKRRNPWLKFWYPTKAKKKTKTTESKRRTQNEIWQHLHYILNDVTREWFWIGKWSKGNAFQNLDNPTKMRGAWKLLAYRYNHNFYQILIKLLQIKMNGGLNDNSLKSKNTGKPKNECSQPTLRRNENDMPDEYDVVEFALEP